MRNLCMLASVALVFAIAGCPSDSTPTVTVKVKGTDCATSDLSLQNLDAVASETSQDKKLKVTVDVYCGEAKLDGVSLTVNYRSSGGSPKSKTIGPSVNGKITGEFSIKSDINDLDDIRGKDVTVNAEDENGAALPSSSVTVR